jgi:hypothetical protein
MKSHGSAQSAARWNFGKTSLPGISPSYSSHGRDSLADVA